MNSEEGRAAPGEKEEGERPCFGRPAATPGQEERGPLLPISDGTPYGQANASPPETVPGDSDGVVTLEAEPKGYFRKATLTLVGAPDTTGLRAKLVHDLLWGRWSRPLDRVDPGDTTGTGAPAPERPSVITNGADGETGATEPEA